MSETPSLSETYRAAWAALNAAATDPGHAFRTAVFATTRPDGSPALRTVILRTAEFSREKLEFFTHRDSDKIRDIANDNRCELLFWDSRLACQLRLRSTATVLEPDQATWDALNETQRQNYSVDPVPGKTLAAPSKQQLTPRKEAMRVIRARVIALEALHLNSNGSTRAVFDAQGARWIAP